MKTYAMEVKFGDYRKIVILTAEQLGVTEEYMDKVVADQKEKMIPRCCVCETTQNLYKDGWYGYRCQSTDCMVF